MAAPADSALAAPPPAATLAEILSVAVAAAREAGAMILAHRGGAPVEATKSGSQDLVTLVDTRCEGAIVARVAAAFPSHAILAEEATAAGRAAAKAAVSATAGAEWLWVVDPIDGTTNFVSGVPLSCVSIGVAHRGRVVAGVVFHPFLDECFTATRGGGAALNGAPLRVRAGALGDLVVGFGTHNNATVGHAMLRAVVPFVDAARGLRALGSAALALAYVAAGRLGAYVELDLSAWDVAAGALLVEEAGGAATGARGEPLTLATRDVLASCGGPAHAAALALPARVPTSDELPAAAAAGRA
jgi:myo-inositol-1(or 4)-monophosphatase